MKKLLISLTAVLALLTACAGRLPPEATSSATPSTSNSGIEFYGTIDTGIGTQKVWR